MCQSCQDSIYTIDIDNLTNIDFFFFFGEKLI
jgi:hypothetical protein